MSRAPCPVPGEERDGGLGDARSGAGDHRRLAGHVERHAELAVMQVCVYLGTYSITIIMVLPTTFKTGYPVLWGGI